MELGCKKDVYQVFQQLILRCKMSQNNNIKDTFNFRHIPCLVQNVLLSEIYLYDIVIIKKIVQIVIQSR